MSDILTNTPAEEGGIPLASEDKLKFNSSVNEGKSEEKTISPENHGTSESGDYDEEHGKDENLRQEFIQ